MVVTRIIGGLGNQMFQYAAGYALAKRLKTELFLDVSEFKVLENIPEATQRIFKLPEYNIDAKILSNQEVDHYKSLLPKKGKWNSFLDKFNITKQSFTAFQFPDEDACVYFPQFKEIKGNVYLKGFFQSEKYFKEYAQELRQQFTLRSPLSPDILEIKQEIFKENAVSIHFRRSDYIHHPVHSQNFGAPLLSYYQEAVEYFVKNTANPVFYVFSDDLEWVKENFSISSPVKYISSKDYIEMHLMAHCKHHIMANSTFSWWGSWLNTFEGKKVIAPSQWFKNPSIPSEDIYREEWITL